MKVEIIDELLKGCKTQEDIFGENGVFKQLVKALTERALQGELTTHLGYEKHEIKGKNSGNSRNGTSLKTVKGENGEIELAIPRDRSSTFEPQLIAKGQTRFDGFDAKILSMYARGLTTRDIQAQLQELYGVEVSSTLISNVTDAVLDEVKAWRNKVMKNKRVFPSDEAAFKQIYLALQNISKKWTMPIRDWKPALARFMIEFEGSI